MGSDPKEASRKSAGRLCMLLILDGWGIESPGDGNAVSLARTPTLDRLSAEYPTTRLVCSGEFVGLPGGIMGNSEVGHLNIGAGRIVYQDLLRIDRSIADGSFFRNDIFRQAMDAVKQNASSLHLMGLVSDGGVHSQLTHLLALLDLAREAGVPKTLVHAIMDGRDTSPTGGEGYLTRVQDHMTASGYGRIASICGRYYAMDRDRRWERIESAYRLYTEGEGLAETDPIDAVRKAYGRGETDEFIKPIALTGAPGDPPAVIADGDAVIFFNFRADRAREITTALTDPPFTGFRRRRRPGIALYATMTLYDETFSLPVAFPPHHLKNILGEVVSRSGIRQLRIAETEKYAHVTYFFNGGEETPFPGEDRVLIPSPREVATYDQKPEMSAPAVTEEVLSRLRSGVYGMVILNFANMDMVGHTGVIPAAVKACETVDRCAAEIVGEVLRQDGAVLVTADHGNAEKMIAPDGKPHTAHTLNPVRLILVDDRRKDALLKEGKLGDIAPTMLEIMGIHKPEEMTGESIIR
ncbi:2,3-bisphosphoglycerate-independent phosphoglycerate mutase [Desulfococcus sp.]|uniref:2,3-bisphosphoglycerate-independent phosphoglycerate mutase n=1 Tax=Desulfococcus sp. TaxID=2025834 RepID=UPI003593065C